MMKLHIRKHERGLVFRRGDLGGVLGSGTHRRWGWMVPGYERVEVVSTLRTRFEHALLDVIVKESSLRNELHVVELSDRQRALLWKENRLVGILGPGLHAFWKEPYDIRVEVIDQVTGRFEHEALDVILANESASQHLVALDTDPHEEVIVLRNGEMVDRLVGGGRYAYWKSIGKLEWTAVDLRERTMEVASQDIITSDKVTLRLTLIVTWTVSDVDVALTRSGDFERALYREAQLVLRKAIASRTLDGLLESKEKVDIEVRDALTPRATALGLTVNGVGLRDVILPGDMKTLLNRVIEAEKEAQANIIRRREETAAARSQANTARLLADNPVLARLKELEVVQEILAGAKTTLVIGGEANLSDGLRRLVSKEGDD